MFSRVCSDMLLEPQCQGRKGDRVTEIIRVYSPADLDKMVRQSVTVSES